MRLIEGARNSGGLKIDPRLNTDSDAHKDYVNYLQETRQWYTQQTQEIHLKTVEWWELFLAQQEDTRDLDEQWQSDVFVPLPFSTTRTKAAQLTELMGNVEPVWQVEATREESNWYEQSRNYEHILDYVHRSNSWRRFLYKLMTARSVQGTAFWKIVWSKRAHQVTLVSGDKYVQMFEQKLQEAEMGGAPKAPSFVTERDGFELWRTMVNKTGRFQIPAPPSNGVYEVTEYEGPVFQYIAPWNVFLDPMVDEIKDQRVIMHRIVKPYNYVLNRADNDPNSAKPYYLENVEKALRNFDGQVLQSEEADLANKLNISQSDGRAHPYFKNAVELVEVWSPEEPFQYSVIMNMGANGAGTVINKRPFERPLLTSTPNLLAQRNVIVPGHFYGLSDYQEPEKLFKELNTFRRLRMNGAMLTTLPAFVKQHGLQLADSMRKLKPGAIYTAPNANGIQSLIRHTLPAEAYREPAEIKMEIEDATEVYSATKGAPATVGRVTGVEFQGRSNATSLKFKIDATMVEEEMAAVPSIIFALCAQLGNESYRVEVGGEPDGTIDIPKEKLIEGINQRFRFRGVTKHIQPDLAVQQITTAMTPMQDVMSPTERRASLRLILEMLDIRGSSKLVTTEGDMMFSQQAQQAQQLQASQTQGAQKEADKANVQAPSSVDPGQAAAAGMGGQ